MVIVNFGKIRIGPVIRNTVFIRQIVLDCRITILRTLILEVVKRWGQQPADTIVPRSLTDTINGVDLVSVLVGGHAEERPPLFHLRTRHTAFRRYIRRCCRHP